MDIFRRKKFDEAMFAKNRTFAIRVGRYQSSDIKEAHFDYGYIKGDTYKPGGTCAGSAKIVFTSIITTFNKLDKVYPEIGLLVDGTYEWVKMGEYFINDIEIDRNRKMTKLDLMDGMFKLNREHVTDLTYPAEIRHVIKEICLKTGIELANEYMDITSMNYRIDQIPKDKKMTFRDVLSLATQMLGMSCFFNREGKLEIKELTDSGITITADSYFMHGLTKSEIEYQIAGITCKKDKETLTVGLRTGRSLELDNLFMSQAVLDNLYHKIKDIRYYPFNLNYQGHLLLNVGEWVTVKTNTGETFKSPILSQSFTFKGGLRGRIGADSKAGNDAQYSYAGTLTKKIEQFNDFEAQIQNQIEEADKGFGQKVEKIKNDFNDQIELAKAKTEEVKRQLSDTIDQRFNSFNNGLLQEAKRRAEEALRNAGASSLLAQEAKRIGLDSIAKLEAFKSQATSAQTALSGDLNALKRTIANDIRPKQEQVTAEIAKQVEALVQTKKELAGVKSAQATYEETTTRRLAELTNLADGKASKSELIQTAEELSSKIASAHLGRRNLLKGTKELARYKPASEYNGFKVIKTTAEATGYRDSYTERTVVSTTGTEYIAIFYARASENDYPMRCHLYNPNTVVSSKNSSGYTSKASDGLSIVRLTTDWQLCWVKWTQTAIDQTKTIIIGRHGPQVGGKEGAWIEICAPALFEGNLVGDWSPAYEDQDERVSAVESNFKQRADSLEAGVNRLTEGLRTKADISSLNVTAENIRQSVKSLETNTQNKLNQKLSTAEFEVRAGSIRQEILNATKDKADKTLVVAEAGKLREELASLSVGGVNLLKKTKTFSGVNGQSQLLSETYKNCAVRYFKNTDSNSAYQNIVAYYDALYPELGGTYTLSFWAKGTCEMTTFFYGRSGFLPVAYGKTSQGLVSKAGDGNCRFTLSADWQRYYVVYKLADAPAEATSIYKHVLFRHNSRSTTDEVWLAGVKLERGNLATDYSENPEDVDGLITEAKATFERTALGLRTDLSAIQEYVNKDGQRQEALQRYTREESARQATAVRELVNRDFVGKSAYQEDVRGLERRFSEIATQTNNDITTKIAQYKQTVDGQFASITSQISGKANQVDFQRVRETSQLYERILGNTNNSIADNVARMAMTSQLFQVEVSKNEGLKTVQRQLADSWSVQNINSAGDLISGINLGANGHNRLDGKLTHITGETLIDKAVIKSAMVDKLKTANFEAGSVTTVVLDAEAVTAEKLKVDQAFFNKLVANEAYLSQLFAKQAFINRVQSVAIDASQVRSGILSGDRIYGGTIRGASIYGGTLTGHTQIQLGSYGSFDTVNGGLQINVPRDYNAKDGLGVQFIGSYGRGENVPYGLFLYRDSDFTIGNTATDTDEFLMTVQGYINAKGIGWLKTGKGSVNGKTTGTIGLWNSNNVSLSFGGSGNDIYYSYNSTAYSLWSVVNQHFSDRRLKENIVDCKHKALDYIQQFQFKEYDWKKQEDRPQQAHTKIGLIAQEVQEVDPTLVYENGDTLNLDNLRLTNIALKAIQELALENQKLTHRLENLENEYRTA
jgi:hypothetical protein|nr:MAG TPA: Neck appendage protein [Caudoviricetes sp.]